MINFGKMFYILHLVYRTSAFVNGNPLPKIRWDPTVVRFVLHRVGAHNTLLFRFFYNLHYLGLRLTAC